MSTKGVTENVTWSTLFKLHEEIPDNKEKLKKAEKKNNFRTSEERNTLHKNIDKCNKLFFCS